MNAYQSATVRATAASTTEVCHYFHVGYAAWVADTARATETQ